VQALAALHKRERQRWITGIRQIQLIACRHKDRKALKHAATMLLKHSKPESAKEVLLKLEDWPALIKVSVDAEAWSHAFMTAKRCPGEEPALHETYAEWLISHDRCFPLYPLVQDYRKCSRSLRSSLCVVCDCSPHVAND
jgi:hypothetical protein